MRPTIARLVRTLNSNPEGCNQYKKCGGSEGLPEIHPATPKHPNVSDYGYSSQARSAYKRAVKKYKDAYRRLNPERARLEDEMLEEAIAKSNKRVTEEREVHQRSLPERDNFYRPVD